MTCRTLWLIITLALSLLVAALAAVAQPPTHVHRIGVLLDTTLGQVPYVGAFLEGMRTLGYIEGQNLVMEYRGAEGQYERRFCRNFHLRPCEVCSPPVTQGEHRGGETMAVSFQGAHVPQAIILTAVRWSVAYPLRTRHVEELRRERGVHGDHSTVNRGVLTSSPPREDAFHRRTRPVRVRWRLDEPSIKSKGAWRYLSRAGDKQGQTMDVLLTEQRDQEAA